MAVKGTRFYAVAAAIGAVILLVANLDAVWRPWTGGVITHAWPRFLWAINIAALVQLGGNTLLAFKRPERLRCGIEWLFAAAALGVAIAFAAIFPVELARIGGPWLDFAVRIVAVLGIAGAGLALVVQTVRVMLGPRPPRLA
jgi:hypothetical protein